MFAVPGWSLPSASLQAEKPTGGSSGAKSRKRKRGGAKEATVTTDNVADLYEAVVEGKKPAVAKTVESAKRKKGSDGETPKDEKAKRSHDDARTSSSVSAPAVGDDKLKKDKKSKKGRDDGKPEKKKKKKSVEEAEEKEGSSPTDAAASVTRAKTAAAPPSASSTLTPLQASMREKLVSARFRHLNETLYTQPSGEALSLFTENPEMFDEYHEGFRRQVKVWPENPVNSFVQDIRTRARIRTPAKGRFNPSPAPTSLSHTPLPRTAGTCVIADLGCGDARLAECLQEELDKARLEVRSYDLQSNNPLVTQADISQLPVEDGSVNVAIFCLALMGTNWLDFIEEAYRVLHWKGELWVAEIKSRFAAGRNKQQHVVSHSVGNRRKPPSKKETAARDAEARGVLERDLAVEVDGIDDTRRETDVSAFVDALKKRGFLLNGERGQAVELSNKMFVKMHFVKAAKPQEAALPAPPRKKMMFQYDQGKEDEVDEAAILKPCVYKIR